MRRTVASILVLCLLGAIAAAAGLAAQDIAGVSVRKQLRLAKKATERYRSVAQAEADGYRTTLGPDGKPVCVSSPLGAMGIHYANPALAADNRLDIRRPEILVYAPSPDGSLTLVALEYFKADQDGNLLTSADRPVLFGHGFDGPMEGHEPGMPVHYDLHVWLWRANPLGMFEQWNPNVTCPEG
jgi:hypothetical protein